MVMLVCILNINTSHNIVLEKVDKQDGGVALRHWALTCAATLNKIIERTKHTNVAICKQAISNFFNLFVVLETGAGQGGEPCARFEDLRVIIDAIDNKSRIGVCFDTCHVFAAGNNKMKIDNAICSRVWIRYNRGI
jgi:deoxyribonuclease-4